MKVLMVIAREGFRDEEYFKPKAALEAAGHLVVTAAGQAGPARGKLGGQATAGLPLAGVKLEDYAGLVFVGGPGATGYFEDSQALDLAARAWSRGLVVAAICIAPGILARAGVLAGRRATVFPGEEVDFMKAAGAEYQDRPVVVDGRLVTANGPEAADDFGRALVRALADRAAGPK